MQHSPSSIVAREAEVELLEGQEAEVGVFILVDSQDSGFIKKGTEKLPEPDQLRYPSVRKIMARSAYAKFERGKTGYSRVPIRYINGVEEIHVDKQDKAGIYPNPNADLIEIKNGQLVVSGQGETAGLLNFMRLNSHNITNTKRIPTAEAIFKEIFPEKEKELDLDQEFLVDKALSLVGTLVLGKNSKGGYLFDDLRLEAFSRIFNVVADSPAATIQALRANARLNPSKFLDLAKEFEDNTMADISHAVQLGLIQFGDTSVSYVGENKIIKTYSKQLTDEYRVRHLSSYFQTAEGHGAYSEFKAKLAAVKNKSI